MLTRLRNLWKLPFFSFWFQWRKQETALGVFLDIVGAFRNTSCGSMCASLVRYRVGYTIFQWIQATLNVCLAMVTLNGSCMSAVVPH